MVFFQATLLAGYAYAHALTRHLPGRRSVIVHLVVMAVACSFCRCRSPRVGTAAGRRGAAFWLLGLFAVSIGLPFFALSANGPLLQAWFARTDHPAAANPYFLYAASNIGSFLALLSYPFVIEPFTGSASSAGSGRRCSGPDRADRVVRHLMSRAAPAETRPKRKPPDRRRPGAMRRAGSRSPPCRPRC